MLILLERLAVADGNRQKGVNTEKGKYSTFSNLLYTSEDLQSLLTNNGL